MGILETICEEKREEVARSKRERPASGLEREASPPRAAFAVPVGAADEPVDATGRGILIAECKRASPSRGLMVQGYATVSLALAYERGGAAVVSVLTESRHFLGSDEHLQAVRKATSLPVLRKDFIVDGYQIDEAWSIGADAVLLIADALSASELCDFASRARERGLSVLIELRQEEQIAKVLAAAPDAVGVNARDLRDFSVHRERAAALASLIGPQLPKGTLLVAESGMKLPTDAALLRDSGYRGFLVGEALATSADPEATARQFVAAIEKRKT